MLHNFEFLLYNSHIPNRLWVIFPPTRPDSYREQRGREWF